MIQFCVALSSDVAKSTSPVDFTADLNAFKPHVTMQITTIFNAKQLINCYDTIVNLAVIRNYFLKKCMLRFHMSLAL